MSDINKLLCKLNVWSKCGSVKVWDNDKDQCGFEELKDDDVVIYYDWSDDELSDDESNEFTDWLYNQPNFFHQLHTEMSKLGYVGVFDNDGSGSGLYYGCEVFRKIA